MDQRLSFLLLLLLCVALPARADLPDNALGLYFSPDAMEQCAEGVQPFTTLTMYLVLSNPTLPAIDACECGITQIGDPATYVGNRNPCGLSIAQIPLERIQIHCYPLPTSQQHNVLMSFDMIYTAVDGEMAKFLLHGPVIPNAEVGPPVVQLLDGTRLPLPVDLLESIGATAAMTGYFDVCCPLPTLERSWDSIKSLYR